MNGVDSAAARPSLLVVDDEEGIRTFLVDALGDAGYAVSAAADGQAALALLARQSFHVVLTDLKMPGMGGAELLHELRREYPDTEVIILTAHGSIESAVEAMKHGAFDYLQKPLSSPAELRLLVARALERRRLRAVQEISGTSSSDPPLGYGAPSMVAAEQALRKVAATNATVLLLGESGVGKEVAARAVHGWSARRGGPFVAVNCAALSPDLLESELFGHERGAFTGAHARQRGRIELAEGGTFFLDEVGELAFNLQAKLLRVLQEKRFERVGGHQTVEADVRWIAATNRNLSDMITRRTFREDLFHRLAVFPVRLPALRERREDIAPLAEHLLVRIARDLGKPHLVLSQDARDALGAAGWPGNVRQLANVLERSAILAERGEISATDLTLLPDWTTDAPTATAAPAASAATLTGTAAAAAPAAATAAGDLPTTVVELEREAIARALAATGGNRRRAAARLGMGVRTLYEKLKRYDLA